jgi:hypothetical protein
MEVVTKTKELQANHLEEASPDFSRSPTVVEYSKYNSLASPDHIRLLRIIPGDTAELVVSLEEVNLEKTSYECLSYTWDGPRYDDIGDEVRSLGSMSLRGHYDRPSLYLLSRAELGRYVWPIKQCPANDFDCSGSQTINLLCVIMLFSISGKICMMSSVTCGSYQSSVQSG